MGKEPCSAGGLPGHLLGDAWCLILMRRVNVQFVEARREMLHSGGGLRRAYDVGFDDFKVMRFALFGDSKNLWRKITWV
jgi:hypothetical protein